MIARYAGEVIGNEDNIQDECYKRNAVYKMLQRFYFFDIQDSDNMVDPTFFGNKSKFINHAKGVFENAKVEFIKFKGKTQVILRALKNIIPGQEILFDYGMSNFQEEWKIEIDKKFDQKIIYS